MLLKIHLYCDKVQELHQQTKSQKNGSVAEWLKATVLKTVVWETAP